MVTHVALPTEDMFLAKSVGKYYMKISPWQKKKIFFRAKFKQKRLNSEAQNIPTPIFPGMAMALATSLYQDFK